MQKIFVWILMVTTLVVFAGCGRKTDGTPGALNATFANQSSAVKWKISASSGSAQLTAVLPASATGTATFSTSGGTLSQAAVPVDTSATTKTAVTKVIGTGVYKVKVAAPAADGSQITGETTVSTVPVSWTMSQTATSAAAIGSTWSVSMTASAAGSFSIYAETTNDLPIYHLAANNSDGTLRYDHVIVSPANMAPSGTHGALQVDLSNVYIMFSGNSDDGSAVVAYDVTTGTQRWIYNNPAMGIGMASDPVDGKTLYLLENWMNRDGTNAGNIVAINTVDGSSKWTTQTTMDYINVVTCYGGSVFAGGTSADGVNYFVSKYDKSSGNLVFEKTFSPPASMTDQYGNPGSGVVNAISTDGSGVYFAGVMLNPLVPGSYQSYAAKIDLGGQLLWANGTQIDIQGMFAATDGSGYFAVGSDGPGAAVINKYNPNGSLLWTSQISNLNLPQIAVSGSAVYAAGIIYNSTGGVAGVFRLNDIE
ncbi:PQQ-binding-like beta-propeller repeat protein [Oryzomonas sagensis]|nr:PQQ-binding-like beta-propeller repeat protein [Oryzomonas sagensis]